MGNGFTHLFLLGKWLGFYLHITLLSRVFAEGYVGIIVINGLGNGKRVIMTIIKCIEQIRESYNDCGNVRGKSGDDGNN